MDDLSRLNEDCRKLRVEISTLMDKIQDPDYDSRAANIPHKLGEVRNSLSVFITAFSKYTQTAASHIFVFMISPTKRDKKPYAIPIQCVPYRGMKESTLRKLTTQIAHEMHHRKMKVAGKLVNGCVWLHILLY